MNKSSKISNFTTYNGEKEVKNCWKKSSTSDTTTNNSTLSLHIAAYESSFDADVLDQHVSKNNEGLTEKQENTKFDALTFFIQVI